MALSDLAVRKARATGRDYTLTDVDGLSLAVSAKGSKSWHFRYYWLDRQKRMSLGTYPEVSLREARALKDKARALLASGVNPKIHRKQRRYAARLASENTFKAVYDKWIAFRRRDLKEGRQTTLTQIQRIFARDVLPSLGRQSIDEITRNDLLDIVGRIERRKALSVAEKVRTWFNQMFRYALVIVPGLEINPASDLDVVAEPQPPVRHNPFLRMDELPLLLRAVRNYRGRLPTQLGLRLLLLTGVRTGELRAATPDQFHLDRELWIIPPEVVKQIIMEMRRKRRSVEDIPPYIVPLSIQAMEIVRYMLAQCAPAQRYLFANQSDLCKRMSENTLNGALKRMGYKNHLTGHGIRATISTALNEFGYPKVWVDAQLSHSDPDQVSSAYNHAEYVGQRRRMMQDWADRLDLFEQGKADEASAHLTIELIEGMGLANARMSRLENAPAASSSPSLLVSGAGSTAAPSPVQRLPAFTLPRSGLQPELSAVQRERMEMLEIFNAPHNLSAADFAKAAGKSKRAINYDVCAGKLLSLELGNQGRRIPDWHLDPLKDELMQSALKRRGAADPWRIYRVLTTPHNLLKGKAPIEALTRDNFPEALMAVCFALREGHENTAPS